MKKTIFLLVIIAVVSLFVNTAEAQCSICTRTAEQLGEQSAKGLNAGILYLAAAPLAILGILGFRWYKNNAGV